MMAHQNNIHRSDARAPWQSRARNAGGRVGFFGRTGGPIIWSGFFLCCLLLFSGLIWLLMYTPQRTAVYLFTAAPYPLPLPPQSWVAEDIDRLRGLDQQTISLHGDDTVVFDAEQFESRFRQAVIDCQNADHKRPAIFYIAMHGVAESETGPAYLVPPNASQTDPQEWIDVGALLRLVEEHPPANDLLLIFDCQRMLDNWRLGLPQNHFVAALREQLAERSLDRTTILASCGENERALGSPELQSTVFGTQLHLGLAGDADQGPHGDRDGWVSWDELRHYLSERVPHWNASIGGRPQHPAVISQSTDFHVARSMGPDEVKRLVRQSRDTNRAAPWIAAGQLDELWKRMDRFRKAALYQADPITFRSLEHQLLWLETLVESGRGYRELCQRCYDDLSEQTLSAEQRLDALTDTPSVYEVTSVLSGTSEIAALDFKPHTLALARYFGSVTAANALAINDCVAGVSTGPNPQSVRAALATLQRDVPTELASTRFLRMVERYQTPRLWQRSEQLARLVGSQQQLQALAVPQRGSNPATDARSHAWTRQLFSFSDRARRVAEDGLFSDDRQNVNVALTQIGQTVSQTREIQTQIDAAFLNCDTAMAEVAYLADWLVDRRRHLPLDQVADRVRQTLLPLIHATQVLAGKLQDVPQSFESLEQANQIAIQLNTQTKDRLITPLESLRDLVKTQQDQLLVMGTSGHGEVLGDLEAILDLPMLRWETRRDLRQAYRSLEQQLSEQFTYADAPDPAEPAATETPHPEAITPHPLDAILGLDAATTGRIARFRSDLKTSVSESVAASSLGERSQRYSRVANRIRLAAPIGAPYGSNQAIATSYQVHLQRLLLWQAERALDDFWGPAGQPQSFYDVACQDYRGAIITLGLATGSEDQNLAEVAAFDSQLQSRRVMESNWIKTQSGPAVQLQTDEPAVASLTVRCEASLQGPDERPDAQRASGFPVPTGTGALMCRVENQGMIDVDVQPSGAISIPAFDVKRTLSVASADATGGPLQALTVFRGHEFATPLTVESVGGYAIQLTEQPGRTASVTLNAPREPLSVAFVLDGSASMADPLDAGLATQPRIEVAKTVLQDSLLQLASRGDCRAAIRFFGHRIGWSTDRPVRPVPRPDLNPVTTSSVRPSQDVEAILRLSPLSIATIRDVIPAVRTVKPWGQSPLYLSLVESLNDFRNLPASANSHIVVITDGANYQFIPPDQNDVNATRLADVRRAWSETPVPIHILGLGMNPGQDAQAINEFEQLCRETGGRFHPLKQAGDLKSALSDLLDAGVYHLRASDASIPDRSASLGSPVRVDFQTQNRMVCEITYSDKHSRTTASNDTPIYDLLQLSPRQSLQLYVDRQSQAVLAYPFHQDVAAQSNLIDPLGNPTDHLVRVHRPKQDASGTVAFPVSWQRTSQGGDTKGQRFVATPEPENVWITIQPMNAGGNPIDGPYVYYDKAFTPNQPVPVMDLVAQHWPSDASHAKINVWTHPFDPARQREAQHSVTLTAPLSAPLTAPLTAPLSAATTTNPATTTTQSGIALEIPVTAPRETDVSVTSGVSLQVAPTVNLDDGNHRVRLVLRCDRNATIPEPKRVTDYKLELVTTGDRKPARIERRFDQHHGFAVHTFWFSGETSPAIDSIRVVDQIRNATDAWRLPEDGLIVPVVQSSGFLRAARRAE